MPQINTSFSLSSTVTQTYVGYALMKLARSPIVVAAVGFVTRRQCQVDTLRGHERAEGVQNNARRSRMEGHPDTRVKCGDGPLNVTKWLMGRRSSLPDLIQIHRNVLVLRLIAH